MSAEESIKCALLIGLSIAILDPKHIEHDASKMSKNMTKYGKGLQKSLIKLALEMQENT